jgi:MYXO-CTERM domain-containing protein
MTSLIRRTIAAAVFAGATLVPCVAGAYCRTTSVPVPPSYSPTRGCFTEGLPLYWKNQCISYSMNSAASDRVSLADASAIMEQAFTTWTSEQCNGTPVGIAVSATEPVTCAEVRYNQNGPNQNVIVFRDTTWPYSDPNNTLGLTTVTFNADNGEIFDADMEINASGKNLSVGDPVPANGFDLLSVVTHEAGHFLGLAHATSPTSTMYASYKPGTTSLRSLTADDIDGLCSIYPTKAERNVDKSVSASGVLASDQCDATPRHGFGTTCAETPASTGTGGCATTPGATSGRGAILVALAAGVAAGRRRRAST